MKTRKKTNEKSEAETKSMTSDQILESNSKAIQDLEDHKLLDECLHLLWGLDQWRENKAEEKVLHYLLDQAKAIVEREDYAPPAQQFKHEFDNRWPEFLKQNGIHKGLQMDNKQMLCIEELANKLIQKLQTEGLAPKGQPNAIVAYQEEDETVRVTVWPRIVVW